MAKRVLLTGASTGIGFATLQMLVADGHEVTSLDVKDAPAGAAAQNWNAVFYLFAIVYVIGGLSWLFIDSTTPLEAEPHR